jgi:hypothetical protein
MCAPLCQPGDRFICFSNLNFELSVRTSTSIRLLPGFTEGGRDALNVVTVVSLEQHGQKLTTAPECHSTTSALVHLLGTRRGVRWPALVDTVSHSTHHATV